jgi:hypothetical protein
MLVDMRLNGEVVQVDYRTDDEGVYINKVFYNGADITDILLEDTLDMLAAKIMKGGVFD